jgi:hypothetical protein
MSFRVVQSVRGTQCPLVLCYLVGEHLDADLRAALPGATLLATSTALGEPLTRTLARARAAGWQDGPLALVGYSAGCQAVRQLLLDGADPAAVLCVDGTHATLPPPRWQIDVWQRFATRSRAGERLFVASCTEQLYVEDLPAAQRFSATLSVLRAVTGWPLDSPGPLPLGAPTSEGALHVHAYESARIDKQAHIAQQRLALPALLRLHVAPWLARLIDCPDLEPPPGDLPTGPQTPDAIGAASTLPPPPALAATHRTVLRRGDTGDDVAAWQRALHAAGVDPGAVDGSFGALTASATRELQARAGLTVDGVAGPRTRSAAAAAAERPMPAPPPRARALGRALLEPARRELASGAREEPPGSNDGPAIRRYFQGSGIAPPAHWCGAFLRWCLDLAAIACELTAPVPGSAAAKGWQEQLIRAGRWYTAAELRADPTLLREGMVVVWHRGAPTSWTGHVGVVSRVEGDRFWSVEGNSGPSGDRVAEMPHRLADTLLLGAGWVD